MGFHEKTADLLYSAVKRATVCPMHIEKGALIVITAEDEDTVGVVESLETRGDFTDVVLYTDVGAQSFRVTADNFIHVIQKVAMLDLREHHQYERKDEKMNKEVDMIQKNKGKHKERPEFGVEDSEKSVLPSSKVSLSLRKNEKEG